ncbi:hypothetical protein KO498_06135 [Lentibacter algarum]|nr:hypothetical protein [Lentibacter algarum]
MFYSHDTFGLGHLRRSRALASAITQSYSSVSALILTGSPVAGRFAFPDRVDHIRLPGVTKNAEGHYVSQALGLDIDDTTALRSGIIKATVENFAPDLLIVDKEPTGFRGELLPSLDWLKEHTDTKLILGLRDVLDSPDVLADEWERKGALDAAEKYYDEVWVYGLKEIYDPCAGLALSDRLRARMHWTGYIHREIGTVTEPEDEPYILVTPGGGGDGAFMVDLLLSAYEQDPELSPKAVLVYGPFLSGQTREDFEQRIEQLKGRVRAVGFESQIENLFAGAEGVVSMGGYNTFCEILSFNKPAIIVPRVFPRKEQFIRASRAEELGLIRMLDPTENQLTVENMITAIRALPAQKPPSEGQLSGLLGGLDTVTERVSVHIPTLLERAE